MLHLGPNSAAIYSFPSVAMNASVSFTTSSSFSLSGCSDAQGTSHALTEVWQNWIEFVSHLSVLTILILYMFIAHALDLLMDFCNFASSSLCQSDADTLTLLSFQWLPRSWRKATAAQRMNSKGKTPKKPAESLEARWRRRVPSYQCGSWSMRDSIGRFHTTQRWRHPPCFPFWNAIWSQKVSMPGGISLELV